jgi:anaerobic magnesium-protoporphyrin IX monomethyl ester cyclase
MIRQATSSDQRSTRDLVAFIDPLEGEREVKIEISIPGRKTYSGSPVGIKDPIALQYIAAYFEREGYRTTVLLRGLMGNLGILQRIEAISSELTAICIALHSTYLVPSTVELAQRIKEIAPNVPIIVGGYHPTGDTDIVLAPGIDFAVIGEGEETCLALVRALSNGASLDEWKQIEGIAFRIGESEKFVTPARGRVDFGSLPWPKRERDILELCQPGPLSYPPVGRVAQVSYSRGCPYGCSFCASPGMWKRRVNYRSAEDMAAEMEHLINEYGVNNFFFCDLSFNGNRQELLHLCDAVEKLKDRVEVPFGSHVMCTSTIIDERILAAMKRANFWKIDYGIEDILEGTISRIKSFQRLERIRSTLAFTNRHGILMRGLMMIGYPWETEETVMLREDLIDQFPVDQLRICFYTPFKGTEMYEETKDRIIVGLDGFTTDRPAIRCDGIDSAGLLAAVPRMLQRLYNSENYYRTMTTKCVTFPELADSYYHFYNYLYRKGLMTDVTHERLMKVVVPQRSDYSTRIGVGVARAV